MAELAFRITESGGKTRETTIVDGLTIGRADDSGLKVDDPKASGRHARVVAVEGRLHIEDVGSSNWTVVQNGPVLKAGERHPLSPGLIVTIGDTNLVVFMKGGPARTIAARVTAAAADDSSSSETSDAADPGALRTIADLGAFKTARGRLVICNEAMRRIAEVDKALWIVGRSAEQAQCVIDHPAISSAHASIVFSQRQFFLEDLGSRNGTFLNGERLSPGQRAPIDPESQIRFGAVEALFVVDCDADGKKADPVRWRNALEVLVAEGKITKLQREEAQRRADSTDHHPGEALLELGYIGSDAWRDAIRRGEFIIVNKAVERGGRGIRGVVLVAIAILLGLTVLVIAKPELLKSLGIGAGR